ncbi:MAG: ATP-binding cassette domain-containing protein [Acidimicrobiales bacterium]
MTATMKLVGAGPSWPSARLAEWEPSDHVGSLPVLQVNGLSATAPDGSRLLDDVSFSVQKGWLVAVAGPTGAGKTSLLRALVGSLTLDAGDIRLDGQDLASGSPELRRRVGYVPQEDLLHHQLGLRRTLEYAASLRLPGVTGAGQRSARVLSVLAELGLERQARLAVGALSGGQRKRANLAVELLAEPDLLVLDEPTTGLDPGHERSVMATLRQITDRGRTVLTVTHSMHALSLCDRVIFLAAGGQVAFFGTPDEAVAYFELTDAAEVFAALNSASGSWKERWKEQPARSHPDQPARWTTSLGRAQGDWTLALARSGLATHAASPALPGSAAQLLTLVQRYLDLIRSDRRHVAMLALQGPVLGLLLWAVLSPSGLSPFFVGGGVAAIAPPRTVNVAVFLAISVTWLGTSSAVREIVKEHSILRREKGAGLSVNAYVTSKVVVLGSFIVVQAAVFTAISCIRQAPPAHGAVLGWGTGELMVTAALVGLAAVALGLLLSALVSTPDKAMTVLPVALVAQLVLSGVWGSVTSVPGIAQLSDLTGAHWGVKAIEATVAGNAQDWWSAVITLACLTAGTLVVTAFLVQRRLHPEWALAWRGTSAPARLLPHRQAMIATTFAVSALVALTGTAEAGQHLTKLGSTEQVTALASSPHNASPPVNPPSRPSSAVKSSGHPTPRAAGHPPGASRAVRVSQPSSASGGPVATPAQGAPPAPQNVTPPADTVPTTPPTTPPATGSDKAGATTTGATTTGATTTGLTTAKAVATAPAATTSATSPADTNGTAAATSPARSTGTGATSPAGTTGATSPAGTTGTSASASSSQSGSSLASLIQTWAALSALSGHKSWPGGGGTVEGGHWSPAG